MNPKTRLKELRGEIDEIKQKMQLSSNFLDDSDESPTDLAKIREKQTLIVKLNSLKTSNAEKQESLNKALTSLTKKLQSLAHKKQSAFKSRSLRSKYLSQVSSLEQELEKASSDFAAFSSNLSKRMRNSLNLGHIKSFDLTLNPIESELLKVTSNYNSLKQSLESLEQEAERLENTYLMLQEDYFSAYLIQADLILQREDLEMQLDMMEIQFADEIEYDEDEDDFILQMLKLKKIKDPYLSQISKLENANERIDENVSLLRETLMATNGEICNMCTASPGYEDLKALENKLRQKSNIFKAQSIENIIADVNSLENFDLDEQILKLQLAAIEKNEEILKQVWLAEEKAHLALSKLGKNPENDLQLTTNKKGYTNKIAAINQWKAEVQKIVQQKHVDYTKIAPDSLIIGEFKSQFSSMSYNDHKKLENLLNAYLHQLEKREKFYKSLPVAEKFKEKGKVQQGLLNLLLEKPENLMKIVDFKKNLAQHEKNENNIIESIKQMGIVLNPYKAQMYMAKDKLASWEDLYKSKCERVSICKNDLGSLTGSLKLIRNEVEKIRDSLKNVTSQEFELSTQATQILEEKRANMLASLQELQKNTRNPDELQLYEKNYMVVEAAARLEKATKELKNFDQNIMGIIHNIEQEESVFRKQQQELDAEMKEVQYEQGFIKEYEDKLKKLENMDLGMHFVIDHPQGPLENFIRNEIRGFEDCGMVEKNFMEFVEKNLGKQTVSINGNPKIVQKKYYRFRLEGTPSNERSFYEKIVPLLEGAELYKKLRNSEKRMTFDPMENLTPENCGYAIRYVHLHKSLEKIDVKQSLKPGFDLVVKVDQLQSPKLSQNTLSLIRALGHEENEFDGPYDLASCYLSIPEEHREFYYPFTLQLNNNDRIELIAKNFITFKQWINGINALVKNKKRLVKLRSRIESYTSV